MSKTLDFPVVELTREESDMLLRFLAVSAESRAAGKSLEHRLLTSLAFALRRLNRRS
jgi:hypothetical protein